MKNLTRREVLKYGIGLAGLLVGCSEDNRIKESPSESESIPEPEINPEDYSFGEISERLLEEGFNSPVGLNGISIRNQNSLRLLATVGLEGKIFMDRPNYKIGNEGIVLSQFSVKPSVHRYSSQTGDIVTLLYEFQDSDFFDFWDGTKFVHPTLTEIPARNIFTGCVEIPEGIVVYSNVSNKLILLTENAGIWAKQETPLIQNDELFGIDDLILGSNGLLYAAQSGIEGSTATPELGFPYRRRPRVISIDLPNKLIQEKFLLRPSDDATFENNYGQFAKKIENGIYAGGFLEIGKKHAIVENSPQGKTNTGIDFFVSSYLDNMVLTYKGTDVLSLIKESIFFPTSLQVSQRGDLYISKAPYQIDPSGIDYVLSGQSTKQSLYGFTDNPDDYKTGNFSEPGVPAGFDIKTHLTEDVNEINIDLTNTNSGELKRVTIQKV